MVTHPEVSGSPMATATAPLDCILRTLVAKEQPPRRSKATQSSHGASTTWHPVGSHFGSTRNPNLP